MRAPAAAPMPQPIAPLVAAPFAASSSRCRNRIQASYSFTDTKTAMSVATNEDRPPPTLLQLPQPMGTPASNNSDDAASFSINSSTGAVTLTGDPNYESKASYSAHTVLATDQDGNQAEQTVTLSVTNEDELAPPSLRGPLRHRGKCGLRTPPFHRAATNRDTTDVANPAVTYSLKPNNSDDAASFSINSSTGAVLSPETPPRRIQGLLLLHRPRHRPRRQSGRADRHPQRHQRG